MSNEISAVRLLFDECKNSNPNMTKIDEYIHRCCNDQEDIDTMFEDIFWFGTTLHVASQMAIISKLLDKSNKFLFPIEINAITKIQKSTPLHNVCQLGCPISVRTLLQHPDIEVNIRTLHKETPLHYACLCNHKLVVLELLNYRNLHLNTTDNLSETSFDVFHNDKTIIDINAVDDSNSTALHYACIAYVPHTDKQISNIRILLEQPSIMIYIKDNRGETPFDICKRKLNDPLYKDHKEYSTQLIQLFEDYHIQQRWQSYCFLMIYEY